MTDVEQPAVELEDVSFSYRPGQPVLEDVSVAVPEGEFVAIAGPNGGGKTTMMRLVLGLARPSIGRRAPVRRAGASLLAQGDARLRGPAGADRRTRPVTVREVVSAGRLAQGGLLGPLRARDRAIVDSAIADVGLPTAQARGSRSSRAASSSAPSSPRRSPASRPYSSWTSRRPASTPSPRKRSPGCSTAFTVTVA